MEKKAKVVVVGGGAIGVSTLYNLAKKGWHDCVLLEANDLTSGSTWHAAGLLPLFNMNYSVGQIHRRTIALYSELEEETGLNIGLRKVGSIRFAESQERMDEFNQYCSMASSMGVEVERLSPEEIKEHWPLCDTTGLIGAIRNAKDGYVQPADVTQAMARGARNLGAKIYQQTKVIGFKEIKGGGWVVETNQGEIEAEQVVTATGSYARRTAAMVGLDIPVIPAQHQYIVTEAHPEILARKERGEFEMGVLRDPEGSWYIREEAGGLLLGPYEKDAPSCYENGPGENAVYELFQEDLERLEPHIESAIKRVPIFGESGIKRVYNGAIPYTPDGVAMVGPAPGLRNFWLNEGHSFGIAAGGGSGYFLAEWMVDGYPSIDMLTLDPRRFGCYATKPYALEKNVESIREMFTIHYPDEERPAGRPLRMSPCYDRMKNLGAVFGQKFGWERPNFFALDGQPQEDHWSFRRSKWFEAIRHECEHVHNHVGLLDMTGFAKARVTGVGARDFLENFFASRVPAIGRIGLAYRLEKNGSVISEFTIYTEGENSFYLVSAAGFTRMDHDILQKALPQDGSVQFQEVTEQYGVLVIAGPESRTLLQKVTETDLSNKAFPWLSGQFINVGMSEVLALRVNFVGELGYELHHPISCQNHLFDTLMGASNEQECWLKPFGIRAMDSLRVEKSYRMIGTEFSVEYTALESDISRFIAWDKNSDFVGKRALQDQRGNEKSKLATLELEARDADVIGGNAVFYNGKVIGRVTSGNYGFRVQKSIALAMLDIEYTGENQQDLFVEVLGEMIPAKVAGDSPFDPKNERLRS